MSTSATSSVSVSVIDAPPNSGMLPPTVILLSAVAEVSQLTPKPSLANAETMTKPLQAVVLASQSVAFPSLVAASDSARPSSLSGLAEPSRQTSEGAAKTPLFTTASGGAPNNDFIGQLIDANLQGALYELFYPGV